MVLRHNSRTSCGQLHRRCSNLRRLRRRSSGKCSHHSRQRDSHRNGTSGASALAQVARKVVRKVARQGVSKVVRRRNSQTSCVRHRRRCSHRRSPHRRSSGRCSHHQVHHPVRRRSNNACSRRRNPVRIRRHRRRKVRVGPHSLHRRRLLPRGRRPSRARRRKNSDDAKMKRAALWPPVCICSRLAGQCISTLRNCHGSRLSMSSGKSPGRPVRGVQSVYVPMTGPR